MRKPLLASLLLAPLATACTTDDDGTVSGPGPGPIVTPAAGCTTDVPDNQVVVGCDFGPGIHPFAVADGRVYTVSSIGTYSAIDLASSVKTRLFRDEFSSTTTAHAWGTVVQDGTLYFPGYASVNGGFVSALLSVSATTPTPDGQPTVVAYADEYELRPPMFGDGQRLYAQSTVHEDFSALAGPVVSLDYDGSDLTPRTAVYGMPIGIADDTLFYMHNRTLQRVPKTGGAAEVLATELSDGSFYDRAVDANYAYTTTATAPYEITRFGANGESVVLHTAPEGNVEIPMGPPHELRVDGDWLYFMQYSGTELHSTNAYGWISRVRLDGTGEAETLVTGSDLTPPVFDDAGGLYVGYTRGGSDEPIEGIVVRIAN